MSTHEPTQLEQYESPLTSRVVKEISRCIIEEGDTEAVDELLRFCPRINLIQYLPEEEWGKWMSKDEWDSIYQGRLEYPHV
jgi:hypothetical protein